MDVEPGQLYADVWAKNILDVKHGQDSPCPTPFPHMYEVFLRCVHHGKLCPRVSVHVLTRMLAAVLRTPTRAPALPISTVLYTPFNFGTALLQIYSCSPILGVCLLSFGGEELCVHADACG